MNRFVATPLLTVFAFTLVVTLAGAIFAPNDVWPNLLIAECFSRGSGSPEALSSPFMTPAAGGGSARSAPSLFL